MSHTNRNFEAECARRQSGSDTMVTEIQINDIAARVRARYDDIDHPYMGIRVTDSDYDDYNAQVGDALPCSHVWDDGNWTEDVLDGTSAIGLDGIPGAKGYNGYCGDRVLIIMGEQTHNGEDIGEIVIEDARVMEVIDMSNKE